LPLGLFQKGKQGKGGILNEKDFFNLCCSFGNAYSLISIWHRWLIYP